MKKAFITIVILGLIVGAMCVTNPSPQAHRAKLEEKLFEEVEKSPGAIRRVVNKGLVKLFVSRVGIQDYYIFSLGYTLDDDTDEYVSVGMFNHVFLLFDPDFNRILKQNDGRDR